VAMVLKGYETLSRSKNGKNILDHHSEHSGDWMPVAISKQFNRGNWLWQTTQPNSTS